MGYTCYHTRKFGAVFELYDTDSVGCKVLELFWCHVYDCVGDECASGRHAYPCEGLTVAVVAERSGWEVDFSAFCAFSCHEFAFG